VKHRFPALVAALWWGSLTTIGFLVVPLLFAHLPSPSVAGTMAARLFAAQTWVSVACGVLLLAASRSRGETAMASWAAPLLGFILGGMLLALLSEFAVAPRIVARQDLKLWHGIGSAMYFAQWTCAGVVLWRTLASRPAPA
jgi:hypothetical protein